MERISNQHGSGNSIGQNIRVTTPMRIRGPCAGGSSPNCVCCLHNRCTENDPKHVDEDYNRRTENNPVDTFYLCNLVTGNETKLTSTQLSLCNSHPLNPNKQGCYVMNL